MSTAESPGLNGLEIAVIGMAGRFPGAESIQEFWRNLRDGVESLTPLTEEQVKGVPAAMRRSPAYVRVARTIKDVDQFDASFFGVNPREADVMDPQHRLFLECCWTALEDSGYDPERYAGGVGVYAGSRMNFYLMNAYSNPALVSAVGDLMTQIANEKDYLANRVSYKLNLGGPSVVVQSACSTALVAVHMACQGLLAGECDMALAGGVAVRVPRGRLPLPAGGHQLPGRPHPRLRRQGPGDHLRHRAGRGRAQAAGRRPGRRRHDLRRDQGLGGLQRRLPEGGLHRARRRRPVPGHPGRADRRGGGARHGDLRRGPRHRHAGGGPDRGHGPDQGLPRADRRPPATAPWAR